MVIRYRFQTELSALEGSDAYGYAMKALRRPDSRPHFLQYQIGTSPRFDSRISSPIFPEPHSGHVALLHVGMSSAWPGIDFPLSTAVTPLIVLHVSGGNRSFRPFGLLTCNPYVHYC